MLKVVQNADEKNISIQLNQVCLSMLLLATVVFCLFISVAFQESVYSVATLHSSRSENSIQEMVISQFLSKGS